MGNCIADAQPKGENEVMPPEPAQAKPTEVKNENLDNAAAQKTLQVDESKKQEESAVAIQAAFRQVKAKKEAQTQKELKEQDKPKDAVLYESKLEIPELPDLFQQKVDKSVTNENRMFPAFKLDNGAVYQGQWSKGKQSGYGMMKKVDGTFLEGQWRDGQLDNGAVLYANKDIYVGTQIYGEFHFHNGVVYKGDIQNRFPHGKGVETHPDGTIYEGQFERGLKNGNGQLQMSDGSKYVGEFQKGEIQGKGEFKWADGSSYYGDWYKSCMHGIGTYNWDQKVYKGEFQADKKHGHGTITYADGSAYEGEFVDDRRHGKGKIIKADKSVVECEWKHGELVE